MWSLLGESTVERCEKCSATTNKRQHSTLLYHYRRIVLQMQTDLEPTVQVRDLKRDRVNFILDNVDMACAPYQMPVFLLSIWTSFLDSRTRSDALWWLKYQRSVSKGWSWSATVVLWVLHISHRYCRNWNKRYRPSGRVYRSSSWNGTSDQYKLRWGHQI